MIFKGGKNEAFQGAGNKMWDLLPEGHRSRPVTYPETAPPVITVTARRFWE